MPARGRPARTRRKHAASAALDNDAGIDVAQISGRVRAIVREEAWPKSSASTRMNSAQIIRGWLNNAL